MTLAVAKSSKGTVWVPAYLPSGYELSRVNLAPSGEIVMLVYAVEENDTDIHGQLEIVQGGSISPDGVIVKKGYSGGIGIAFGRHGHIIRGHWVPTVHRNGAVDIAWNADPSVTLFFEKTDELVLMRGEPAALWPDQELVNVAKSLRAA